MLSTSSAVGTETKSILWNVPITDVFVVDKSIDYIQIITSLVTVLVTVFVSATQL